jgi:purine nucleoside permease
MRNCFKRISILLLVAFVFSAAVFAEGTYEKKEVKVLEISMFEVGDNSGDFAGEFQHFYENYFEGQSTEYSIDGYDGTLYLNDDGVAGMIAGMGKAQAAASLTAVLLDKRFDFSSTYIVVSGCGGASPDRATLGDVVIATSLVDYELGHAWSELDKPEGTSQTFMRSDSYDRSAYTVLNPSLIASIKNVVKDVELVDCDDAIAYRALYNQSSDVTPSIQYGVSVTGDSYWHGSTASKHADEVVAAYSDSATYFMTQMEDSAYGVVAKNFGLENNLIIVRDVVNFDQPHDGQSVTESLAASSGAFSIGMTNGFNVASTIIDSLIK